MSNINIIRAWKDEAYRNSLSEAERAALPENPAGILELADTELADVNGGFPWIVTVTVITVASSD
jgi:mersacidin/lichenicidin family type 2 lantibiotic